MNEMNFESNEIKNIEGALLFKLVCSLNQGGYFKEDYIERAVDYAQRQLNQMKEKGYDVVELYCNVKG